MDKIKWLLLSYWAAGIADFVFALIILIPDRAGVAHYLYPTGMFSAVAFSWGILLVLSAKDPLNRRWVLIPTMVVIILLGIASVYSVYINVISLNVVLPRLIIKTALLVLLSFSYIITRGIDRE